MLVPTYDKFMLPILELAQDGRDISRKYLYTELEKDYEDNTLMQNGLKKSNYRIGWAVTFLCKAEMLEKNINKKFTYNITELGLNAIKDCKSNNKELNDKYLKENSPNYLDNWNVNKDKIKEDGINNQDIQNNSEYEEDEIFNLEKTVEELKDDVEMKFIERVRSMEWALFEDFCAKLIEKMNYGVAQIREKRVHDGGIDGIIYSDELGIKDKIFIQAKRYQDGSNITEKDMKEFLYNITQNNAKGIFITTSKFTKQAQDAAKNFQNGQIALIDDVLLVKLCVKYEHGITKKQITILELSI